jgi:hypothetical protein
MPDDAKPHGGKEAPVEGADKAVSNEALSEKLKQLEEQIEELKKRQPTPLDLKQVAGRKGSDGAPEEEQQGALAGKGVCYPYPGCNGTPFDTDVTFEQCYASGGRSWRGAGGCHDMPDWSAAGEPPVLLTDESLEDMTTRTRPRCVWAVTVRRSVGRVFVGTSKLRHSVSSDEIVSQSTQRSELSRILKESLSVDIKHQVTGLGFTSGVSGSMSDEQIRQAVDTFLATRQFILVHYRVTIFGTLVVRKDWTITEVWDWDGPTCDVSAPEIRQYEMRGPEKEIAVSTQFDIWEMYAPTSDRPQGREWALSEARHRHGSLLKRGAWLPELPLPVGFPSQPNIG